MLRELLSLLRFWPLGEMFFGFYLPYNKHIWWMARSLFFPGCSGVCLVGMSFKYQRGHSLKHLTSFNVGWQRWSSPRAVMGESTGALLRHQAVSACSSRKTDEGAQRQNRMIGAHHVGCTHCQLLSTSYVPILSQGRRSLLGGMTSCEVRDDSLWVSQSECVG